MNKKLKNDQKNVFFKSKIKKCRAPLLFRRKSIFLKYYYF